MIFQVEGFLSFSLKVVRALEPLAAIRVVDTEVKITQLVSPSTQPTNFIFSTVMAPWSLRLKHEKRDF